MMKTESKNSLVYIFKHKCMKNMSVLRKLSVTIYNFLNKLIAYVKIEKLYRSLHQNNNKDLGKEKKRF